jgi:hypothetical protein
VIPSEQPLTIVVTIAEESEPLLEPDEIVEVGAG